MKKSELKKFLNLKTEQYNQPSFIDLDPIHIPHRFTLKEDIEIAAFLTAIISWGNRKMILKSAEKMLGLMENSPFDFVKSFTDKEITPFRNLIIHRTFNGEDFVFFLNRLQRIYQENTSMETLFLLKPGEENFYHSLERFRTYFLSENKEHRSKKHLASPYKNSSAKRLMMFLRWMVRKDQRGVDFGIWKKISQQYLSVPLDVHTGNTARQLGLISRKQNDWKSVEELDNILREFDKNDPAKYDFALFGLGVYKEL